MSHSPCRLDLLRSTKMVHNKHMHDYSSNPGSNSIVNQSLFALCLQNRASNKTSSTHPKKVGGNGATNRPSIDKAKHRPNFDIDIGTNYCRGEYKCLACFSDTNSIKSHVCTSQVLWLGWISPGSVSYATSNRLGINLLWRDGRRSPATLHAWGEQEVN